MVSTKPWGQFSESDWKTAESYCSASLIDENPSGQPKTKALCHLPVAEPNGGPLNANGVHAAAARLAGAGGGVKASPTSKRQAARALVRLYGTQLKESAPDTIVRMAK